MKKVWYLFREEHFYIIKDQFIKEWDIYYLYNRKTKTSYSHSESLIRALKYRKDPNRNIPFLSFIIKNQVPLFDSYDSSEYDCYSADAIYQALPKIEVGKPFIDKVLCLSIFYLDNGLPIKQRLALAEKYKKYIETKDPSITITQEEREKVEYGHFDFVTTTLLLTSEVKPTVEDVKRYFPELLI